MNNSIFKDFFQMMKTGLLFFCLLICAIAQAQEYAWTRDSSGVWNLDISHSNRFEQRGVSLKGETLLFTQHEQEDYDYTAPKESRMLLVSRVSPNGEPQVIRKLNFYSDDFIMRKYNNQYYLLTQDHDVRGNRHNNVILEYDSAWNFLCYTRVQLPHFQHYYTDFFPLGNQQFYLLSYGKLYSTNLSNGGYLVRTGGKGRVEQKRFFALNVLTDLSVRNDSVFFKAKERTFDNNRHYSVIKNSVYAYTVDSMLIGEGVEEGVSSFSYRETHLLNGARIIKNTDGILDEITVFNRNNDSLWTWTAEKDCKIKDIIPVDSSRFLVSYIILGETDIEVLSEGAALILFDMNMNQTRLWKNVLISKNKPSFFNIQQTYYSSATNSIYLIHSQTKHQGGAKLGFETVPLPE